MCLKRRSEVSGSTFDDGDLWDWYGRWRLVGRDRVRIHLRYDKPVVCTFLVLRALRELVLSECTGESFEGRWVRAHDQEQ